MAFKFEKLEIWQRSLDYADLAYDVAELLPKREKYNLSQQLRRAATSISLNIAEGSTGQTDREQARFLGHALRSLIETVACLHLIKRRDYVDPKTLRGPYREAQSLAAQISAMRNSLTPDKPWVREDDAQYGNRGDAPVRDDELSTLER